MNRTYSLRRKGFSYAYNRGKFVSDKYVAIIYAANKDKKMKVGFSVSKKFGKAVKRNRIKRRLKACFFSFSDKIDHGYNYIVVPKERTIDCDYKLLTQSFERTFEKSGLFKK